MAKQTQRPSTPTRPTAPSKPTAPSRPIRSIPGTEQKQPTTGTGPKKTL